MRSKYILACSLCLAMLGFVPDTLKAAVSLVGSAESVAVEETKNDVEEELDTITEDNQEIKTVEAEKGAELTEAYIKPFVNKGKNKRTKKFLDSMKKISDIIANDDIAGKPWHWALNPHNETIEEQIKSGHRTLNGGLLPTWGLADCGIFKKHERIYTHKNGEPCYYKENNTPKTMEKYSNLIVFDKAADKLIKSGKLEPGDIVHFCHDHTAVYAGDTYFFDSHYECANAFYKKDGKYYFHTLYTTLQDPSEKIHAVTRLKDPDKKSEEVEDEPATVVSSNGKYDFSDVKGKQNVTNFCKALARISDILEADYKAGKGWYWEDKGNIKTFEGQLKTGKRISNCGIYISWALAEIGVYTHGEAMYIGYTNQKTVKDQKRKKMEPDLGMKYYDIVYHDPNGSKTGRQLLNEGKFKKGDIVLYRLHVNAYAGNKMWWDAGRGTGNTVCKNGKYYFNGCRSKHGDLGQKVYYIIRLKDQS